MKKKKQKYFVITDVGDDVERIEIFDVMKPECYTNPYEGGYVELHECNIKIIRNKNNLKPINLTMFPIKGEIKGEIND